MCLKINETSVTIYFSSEQKKWHDLFLKSLMYFPNILEHSSIVPLPPETPNLRTYPTAPDSGLPKLTHWSLC